MPLKYNTRRKKMMKKQKTNEITMIKIKDWNWKQKLMKDELLLLSILNILCYYEARKQRRGKKEEEGDRMITSISILLLLFCFNLSKEIHRNIQQSDYKHCFFFITFRQSVGCYTKTIRTIGLNKDLMVKSILSGKTYGNSTEIGNCLHTRRKVVNSRWIDLNLQHTQVYQT